MLPESGLSDWPTPLLSHLLIVRDDDPLRPEMTWQPPRRATRIIRLHRTCPPCCVVATAPRRSAMSPATLATYSAAVRGLDAFLAARVMPREVIHREQRPAS